MTRKRFVFRGTIQGVGFRPAVYRTAVALGLGGFVQNRRSEVMAEVRGSRGAVDGFLPLLARNLPAAASIQDIETEDLGQPGDQGDEKPRDFRIAESDPCEYLFPPIPPDLAICDECAKELLDPGNRRYLYPFITCTQCGPRYSIVESTPFDRENTTMRPFRQCAECGREYSDPGDRRFHSQTNSCPRCGPHMSLVGRSGIPVDGDPMLGAIRALSEGMIVAVQGIGGFHLAADPSRASAMQRLRKAKDREKKPFALMARDIPAARALCDISAEEESLLCSTARPIVIAPRAAAAPAHIAAVCDTGTVGVMLPYTPLHLLLFSHPETAVPYDHLVMTSGNRAGEPIITDPQQAIQELSDTAELFLFNDRRIAFRVDDSVIRAGRPLRIDRIAGGGADDKRKEAGMPLSPFFLRRSRGYVPRLLRLKAGVRGVVLGMGGDLKSAPALAKENDIHLLPYIGDLEDPRTLEQMDAMVRQALALYRASPDRIVCDLHPSYESARWAHGCGLGPVIAIQHHFAHALSVMAEHGLEEALALSFDGTGFGTDGTIWGGEFLHATRRGFRRLGSFAPFPLPGGESAVLNPGRIAYSLLSGDSEARLLVPGIEPGQQGLLDAMIGKGVSCPSCSSLGRIFDAAAAALGLIQQASYEGEGPMLLEGIAQQALDEGRGPPRGGEAAGMLPFRDGCGDERLFLIDPRPLIREMVGRRADGGGAQAGRASTQSIGRAALLFHAAAAEAAIEGARRMRLATGIRSIALSGGVFQNALFRGLLVPPLMREGFAVYLNVMAPPGDGGLSVGQAWFEPG